MKKLLFDIIDSYNDYDNSGLPIGNQTSQCFALYYLDKLDRIIKERHKIKYYSRYMDDGIIICNDKNKLKVLLNDIKEECSQIRIELNVAKTRIYKLKEGFTYLGFRFRLNNNGKIMMVIPKIKKKRIIKHLRKLNKDEYHTSIVFYKGYLLKGNNYCFYYKLKTFK